MKKLKKKKKIKKPMKFFKESGQSFIKINNVWAIIKELMSLMMSFSAKQLEKFLKIINYKVQGSLFNNLQGFIKQLTALITR